MATPEHTLDPGSPPEFTQPDGARPSDGPANRHRARAMILRLHFYAGVLVAPFILVAAVTGALYALAPSVEGFVYREIQTVEPTGAPLTLADQAAAADAAVPQLEMTGMRPACGWSPSPASIYGSSGPPRPDGGAPGGPRP